jgi:hypothetical protein
MFGGHVTSHDKAPSTDSIKSVLDSCVLNSNPIDIDSFNNEFDLEFYDKSRKCRCLCSIVNGDLSSVYVIGCIGIDDDTIDGKANVIAYLGKKKYDEILAKLLTFCK